jgi:tol-pal system protein YbgF
LSGFLLLVVTGCGSAEGAERRQLERLEEGMRNDTQAADSRRVDLDPAGMPGELSKGPLAPSAPARPRTTIALGEKPPVPDDEEPGPDLKIVGTGGRREESGLTVEPEGGQKTAANSGISALDPAAKQAYDAALKKVLAKEYDQGLEGFAGFLAKWPDHPNADNAIYWRGECYFAKGELSRAASQFEDVVVRFPLGNKVPDALYKLGLTYKKLGQTTKAKSAFEKLEKEYPRSDAARKLGESKEPGQ